ncbi:hypothetical protein RI367_007271 [Sorochytrium milnesiophthora]
MSALYPQEDQHAASVLASAPISPPQTAHHLDSGYEHDSDDHHRHYAGHSGTIAIDEAFGRSGGETDLELDDLKHFASSQQSSNGRSTPRRASYTRCAVLVLVIVQMILTAYELAHQTMVRRHQRMLPSTYAYLAFRAFFLLFLGVGAYLTGQRLVRPFRIWAIGNILASILLTCVVFIPIATSKRHRVYGTEILYFVVQLILATASMVHRRRLTQEKAQRDTMGSSC